jgi:Flp pilus assembly protein TadD
VSNIWTEPEIFFNKGVVMEERGNAKQAKRLYSLALDIRPSFPQALHNLGFLYLRMKVSEGFSYLRRAIL